MASSSSGWVAGLTAAALAAVGFLAYQASANVADDLGTPSAATVPAAVKSKAPAEKHEAVAVLPGDSGSGQRVVYSLGEDRVWLVGADNKATRTFKVTPSTVDPAPGIYQVTSRTATITGSDGRPVEHVVRFTTTEGVPIGFSAAVDGSTPRPDPATRTGGIRESREDGKAMWEFATHGRQVVVVK